MLMSRPYSCSTSSRVEGATYSRLSTQTFCPKPSPGARTHPPPPYPCSQPSAPYSRHLFVKSLASLLLLALPLVGKPLNVVFFLVDDLGYMDVSPNNPDTFYDTPNIQALADSGMRFTDAYAACPVCSPTRSSILDAAALPALPKQHKDGASFTSLLKDPTAELNATRALYWDYPHWGNQGSIPGAAIREGGWKLIAFDYKKGTELYNLAEDPGEKTNLAGKNADRVKAMRANLDEVRSSTGAFRTSRNPDFNPNDFRKW